MPTIRSARSTDAGPLARLAETTFRATFGESNPPASMDAHCARSYGADLQAREIADPAMRTLVCEHEGALIAFGQLHWDAAPACVIAERPARVQRFYVDARWHGAGVAPALMTELVEIALAGAADRVWLGVWERNARAVAFYRKFGFTIVGEHAFLFGDEIQRDLVMSRPARQPSHRGGRADG